MKILPDLHNIAVSVSIIRIPFHLTSVTPTHSICLLMTRSRKDEGKVITRQPLNRSFVSLNKRPVYSLELRSILFLAVARASFLSFCCSAFKNKRRCNYEPEFILSQDDAERTAEQVRRAATRKCMTVVCPRLGEKANLSEGCSKAAGDACPEDDANGI